MFCRGRNALNTTIKTVVRLCLFKNKKKNHLGGLIILGSLCSDRLGPCTQLLSSLSTTSSDSFLQLLRLQYY